MIKAYSAAQVRDAERPHLAAGEPLMARAAAGLADEIRRQLDARSTSRAGTVSLGRSVLLLVGSGNNGADALYAGAELAANGSVVSIIQTSERTEPFALKAAVDAGATIQPWQNAALLASRSDVVVDAILGTGTSTDPALRGRARTIVREVMGGVHGAIIVAVDVPSGIGVDDGSAPDPVVLAADVTVTFGAYKAGLLIAPGSILAGRIRLIDIGLAADLGRLKPLLEIPGSSDSSNG